MEVSKKEFDRFNSVIGPNVEFPEQSKLLEEINFDLEHDCDRYFGMYFPNDEWKRPDSELVYTYFQTTLKNPDKRYKQYIRDNHLTPHELEGFIKWRKEDYEQKVEYGGTWIGKLSCGSEELVVFTERYGCSFEGVEIRSIGIAESIGQGVKTLYPDGEIIEWNYS